jgi:two-component system, cell cycle sensor histidine kinase and response regulator CckA
MGGRVTRPAQSPDPLRADHVRQSPDAGAAVGFIPAGVSGAAPAPALSWNLLDQHSALNTADNSFDQRREFLEQLFENSPDALLIVDPAFRSLCANRQFERMFGYSAEQTLGQAVDTLILPRDRDAEAKWISECLQGGEQITLDTQRRHRDGTTLDVSVTAAPLLIQGRIAGFYFLYRDISDRRRTESLISGLYRLAEKTAAADDLQQLFAAVHGIVDELIPARNFSIALHDPESQQLSFPYFFDERESAPAAASLAHAIVDYVMRTGEPLLATPELLAQLQHSGELKTSELKTGELKTGDLKMPSELSPAPLQWLAVPLKTCHHIFGALLVKNYSDTVLLRDRDREVLIQISRQLSATLDHKRNEQSLRRSEVRYRSLVQTAVYGMYRSSLEGQFLDINPALVGMLGYNSTTEVLALDPAKDVFLDPKEYSSLSEEFRRTGRMDGFEARWKRKDGAIIFVRISGRAVATEDHPADVLEAIAEDVTERRLLEDQFRQSQKMEAVGRLASGIAHDFNNLLMVVSGYTEVLLEQLPPGHPLHSKAEAIRQASDRATALTRQLLAFSRKQLLELKIIDLNAIVSSMERLLRPLIGEDIEVFTTLDPSAGCTRADAGQVEQVIMNLVVNARDAMPNGGKLSLRTANVTLDSSYRPENTFIKHGPYIMLSISDTGHGMDRETQARIFEPFFTTKEKGKGTGLGLSTVYGIIKQTGGYIFVQSELGRGTVFNIYLPRAEEVCDSPSLLPAIVTVSGGSETILLVEDEDSVRQLVRETLEAGGYRVLEAANGHAAITLAAHHSEPIDLIITDVVMPGLSGHELIHQLIPSRPNAKILYLSGYTEDAVLTPATPGLARAFLQKPFTLQTLSRKVREVLAASTN